MRIGGVGRRADERGMVLTLVLIVFLVVEVIVAGALSVVLSDLQASVAGQQALHAVSVAEAGLNYGVAQLVSRATAPDPTADAYAGEPEDVPFRGTGGRPLGFFSLTVTCVYPSGASPPDCADNPATAADERDQRHIRSTGFVPARPGRARRQIEATVRRYVITPGDDGVFGICGRQGVEIGPDTSLIADIGSNGDVTVDGPKGPGAVVGRLPRAPSLAPLAEAVTATETPGLSGTYSWRVTFSDERDQESGGSAPTLAVALADQHAFLTQLPVGDEGIVRRRIYRTAADSPRGPWFLVGEVTDNVSREYVDGQPDETLRWRIPGNIRGGVTAAGDVSCAKGCDAQVDGPVRAGLRAVVCPNFLAAPADPGVDPVPEQIVQTAPVETARWGSLHVRAGKAVTIETLSVPNAELHLHVADVLLEHGSRLAVTGAATVYVHVRGRFVLEEGAVFGAIDLSGNLLRPADRLHVLVDSQDPIFEPGKVASVRWAGANKVAALVFAPGANILIERAAAVRGGLYGRFVRISRSSGIFLDPIEGLGSEKSIVRPSPFQYVLRWYDNPRPAAGR